MRNVCYKHSFARDSFSSWYRISIDADAAVTWMEHVHGEQERHSRSLRHDGHELIEGIHRALAGPPPLNQQTGDTPDWWKPPGIEFRATEVMLWYEGYWSGVGRATYSAFDASTGTLWVYSYAAQHDRLWAPGMLPAGEPLALADRGAPFSPHWRPLTALPALLQRQSQVILLRQHQTARTATMHVLEAIRNRRSVRESGAKLLDKRPPQSLRCQCVHGDVRRFLTVCWRLLGASLSAHGPGVS